MSRYRMLHPAQTVTITRLTSASTEGVATSTESAVGAPLVGVEDVTGKVRQGPGGDNVELALRLYTGDVATAYRPRDLVALTHRGQAEKLQVESIVGPFGGPLDHLELLCVSRLGAAVGFNSAVS